MCVGSCGGDELLCVDPRGGHGVPSSSPQMWGDMAVVITIEPAVASVQSMDYDLSSESGERALSALMMDSLRICMWSALRSFPWWRPLSISSSFCVAFELAQSMDWSLVGDRGLVGRWTWRGLNVQL